MNRLKKIQDKKRISRAKAELEKAKRKAEGDFDDEAANILDDAHDEDVLFLHLVLLVATEKRSNYNFHF